MADLPLPRFVGRWAADRHAHFMLLFVAAVLSCATTILPLRTVAQFNEVYPYVKTAVAVGGTAMYFTHPSTNVINGVMWLTGVEMTYSVNDSLSRPSGLSVDADGSLLIADTGNHRIVRLNTTTGELTAEYTTSSPALQWPCDVAVDAVDGSMLVADTWNHRIVKLSSTGQQLAVFNTTAPLLQYPAGVSLDSSRWSIYEPAPSLYIVDTGNNRIVQLSAVGIEMRIYTTSRPSLNAPSGVLMQADGSLQITIFIADSGNDRVVKLSSTGVQLAEYKMSNPPFRYPTGVASNGLELFVADSGNNRVTRLRSASVSGEYYTQSPSLANPTGVAVDSANALIVVDWTNRRLVKLSAANELLAVYAPPLLNASRVALDSAGAVYVSDMEGLVVKLSSTGISLESYTTDNPPLKVPVGVTLNAADEVFVADSGNNRVVKLSQSGEQLAVYNTSSPALNQPLDVALDSAGCLYIVDSGNSRVVKLNSTDGAQLYIFTTAKPPLIRPTAVVLDAAGRVYVVDSGNSRVVKFSPAGGMLAVYTSSTPMRSPAAVALDAAENVLVCDSSNNRVVLFEVHALEVFQSYEPSVSLLDSPLNVALGTDGSVYVTTSSNRIVKRSPTNAVVTVYTVGGVNQPALTGIALDAADAIYVTDSRNHCVVKLRSTGEQTAVFSGSSSALNSPRGLTLDSAGSVLVADYNTHQIVKFSSVGTLLAEYDLGVSAPLFPHPTGVAVDAQNAIYVSDVFNDCIIKLNSSGSQVTVFTTSNPKLSRPSAVAVDASGAIFVLDTDNQRVVKLSPTGVQLAVFTASSPALRIPTGLYLESDGSLLIVDNANERVVQLNATGAQTAAYFDRQVLLSWPTSITMDVAGFYYIADSENARVVKLDSSGAQVAEFTTSNPSLYEPTAVVVDAGGCLYICDKGNDRIVKLNSTGAQMAVFTTNNPQLGAPLAVSLDAHGDLFILDPLNFRVVKLNQSGHQVAMFTTRDPTLRDPEGMLVTPDGTMYISDSGHQRVVQLNSAGVQLNMWVDPWLEDPHGLALDSDGSVYVASAEFGCILKLSHNGTLLYRYVASSPPLEAPTGLMLDASGNLFVANSAYNRIVVFVNPYCKHGHHCPFRTPILCPARFYCPTPQYVQSVAAPTILLCPPRHYCSPGTVEPEECWEKHFCAAGSVEPLPCPAGYYCPAGSDDPTAEHCKAANTTGCGLICPAGSYCPYMSATPTPCPQFTYGDQQGLTNDSCSGHCPNGTYSVRDAPAAGRNSTNCSGLCTLGQYCPWEAEQPLLCPGGSYCPNTTSLLSCKDGYYGDRTGLTVDTCSGPCDAGFICTTNSITPRQLPCPPGQYNNRTGQGKCENCPRGSYAESSANGTQKCTECPIGQHSPREGAVSCQYCPAGQFNNQTGRTECSTCPAGTQAATEAENRTSCSPCPLGYVSIAGTCEPCPRSTYSLLNSSSQCMSCAGIAGVECDGGIAYIDQLWHAAVVVQRRSILNGSSGELEAVLITQRCPVGYCVGVDSSAFSDIILPSAGSTGAAGGDATAVVFPLTGQCSDNRDQSAGTSLCGGCAAGYAAPDVGSPQSGCVRCTGTSYGKIAMLLLTTWLLVLLYYVTSNGRLGLIGCFLYYMQTIAIMVSSQSSLTAWVRTFGFSPVSLMPAACWGTGMSPELQYAMPLLIVPLQLLQLVVTVAVHAALIRYCKPAEYALDELSMTYVRSGDGDERRQQAEPLDDVHERWYQRYARLLQQRVVTLIRYRLWPELTVSTVVRTGFLIVTASFTSIIVTCVSWFSCTADMTMGVTGKSGSVVYAFPAVPCYTSRYYGWSWMMGGCILLWLLATVAASCWLFRHRRQLAALQRRSPLVSGVPVDSMRTFSSLALRPEVASQLVDGELRVTLMRHAPFAWYWPSANAINAWDEPVCDSGVDGVVMESRREYAFRSIYGALYDSFRTEASGWIVVVWLRRLLLIVLSVALTTSPSARYLSFLLLHLIIYCLQGYFEPFATQALNHAERVSILVHVVIASVLLAYPSPSDAAVQSAVLTLTLAPLVLYLVYRQAQRYVLRTSRRSTKARVRVRNEALSVKLLQSDEVEL